MRDKRPNLLFINTDQQRADTIGYYGNSIVKTPNLDKLCGQGTSFQRMYCVHPLCSPARTTWQTGRYVHSHGYWTNGCDPSRDETYQARIFRDAGYATALIGKGHLSPTHGDYRKYLDSVQTINGISEEDCESFWENCNREYFGFSYVRLAPGHGERVLNGGHYWLWMKKNHPECFPLFQKPADADYATWDSEVPAEIHPCRWITDTAIHYLENKKNSDAPFYLWVGYQEPHMPYAPPAPYSQMYNPAEMLLPRGKEADWVQNPNSVTQYFLTRKGFDRMPDEVARQIIARYYGAVSMVDDEVGRLLTTLSRLHLEKDTIIVFTSDHGDWMGDHGLWQKGGIHTHGMTRIPFIVKWENHVPAGRRIEGVASQVDIAATLYDFAGIEPPYGIQGTSLLPAILENDRLPRSYALVESRYESPASNSVYVRRCGNNMEERRRMELNPFDRDIHIKTLVTENYRFTYIPLLGKGELFDLGDDAFEMHNLWDGEPGRVTQFRLQLLDVLMESEDPLLQRTSRL